MDPSSEHTNVGADYSRDGTILFYVDDVPSFVIPDTVKEIDLFAFKDCRSLKEVHIPDSVTFIGSSAFEGCVSLGLVHIPSSVRLIEDYAFVVCVSARFEVDEGNECYSSEDGALYDKDGKVLIAGFPLVHDGKCEIPDHVTRIGASAFDCCPSLEEVHIPDSVTEIGASAFQHCSSLREIDIPDSVVGIGSFAFLCCRRLERVRISGSVEEIDLGAFDCCVNASFDVDERNRFFSSDRGALFDKDGKTLLIEYPLVHGGVCVIPETVTSIGYGAFDCCKSLKEMRIHASVTDIEENAFDECGFVYFTVNRRNQYYYSTRYGELIKYRCCGLLRASSARR